MKDGIGIWNGAKVSKAYGLYVRLDDVRGCAARHTEAAKDAAEAEEVHIEIDGAHRVMTFQEFRDRLFCTFSCR